MWHLLLEFRMRRNFQQVCRAIGNIYVWSMTFDWLSLGKPLLRDLKMRHFAKLVDFGHLEIDHWFRRVRTTRLHFFILTWSTKQLSRRHLMPSPAWRIQKCCEIRNGLIMMKKYIELKILTISVSTSIKWYTSITNWNTFTDADWNTTQTIYLGWNMYSKCENPWSLSNIQDIAIDL